MRLIHGDLPDRFDFVLLEFSAAKLFDLGETPVVSNLENCLPLVHSGIIDRILSVGWGRQRGEEDTWHYQLIGTHGL